MEIRELRLKGAFEIIPKIVGDTRGFFAETYLESVFNEFQLQTNWDQENQSLTEHQGTIRGLHFQAPPAAQTKLVRVPYGKIVDVFVDIRPGSETYGHWDSIEISAELCNAVYIPRGFAHGFSTLVPNTVVAYKVDNPYAADKEGGIRWNDPDLAIDWKIDMRRLSERDQTMPFFNELVSPFSAEEN